MRFEVFTVAEEDTVSIFRVQALKFEAVCSSKTLVLTYQTIQCQNAEDRNINCTEMIPFSEIMRTMCWSACPKRTSHCCQQSQGILTNLGHRERKGEVRAYCYQNNCNKQNSPTKRRRGSYVNLHVLCKLPHWPNFQTTLIDFGTPKLGEFIKEQNNSESQQLYRPLNYNQPSLLRHTVHCL